MPADAKPIVNILPGPELELHMFAKAETSQELGRCILYSVILS